MFTGLLKTYITIGAIILVLIVAGIIYAYRSDEDVFEQIKDTFIPPYDKEPIVVPHQGGFGPRNGGPINTDFKVLVKDRKTVVVRWTNLPAYTVELIVFRAKAGTDDWSKWKTISISQGNIESGEVTISLGSGENANSYEYYIEAASPFSNTSWSSTSTEPIPYTPPPPPEPPAPPVPPPPSPPPTPPEPPTPPPTPPPPPPSGPIYYYSPSGEPISGSAEPTGTFWVRHVNKNIEVGWQNLPANTNKIRVYRSATENGPWSNILTQENPDIIGPTHIRLVDFTISDPYYYEMDTLSNSTILQSYGPEYLLGLE